MLGGRMDAITLLKMDHKSVSKLAREFAVARRADDPERAAIVKQVIEELSIHMEIEEQVFYPTIRREISGLDDDILESFEEHHVLRWTLSELSDMDPGDERYDAKFTVLIEMVRHHVEEEEQDWFPKVRRKMSRTRLSAIGEELEAAKSKVAHTPFPEGGR
jgi:hemerythrin-like domain-containing protein